MLTCSATVCIAYHDQVPLAVTIDKDAKYRFSGACATPERKELSTQGPAAALLHQCDRQLLCFSHHRGPQPLATPGGLQPLPWDISS